MSVVGINPAHATTPCHRSVPEQLNRVRPQLPPPSQHTDTRQSACSESEVRMQYTPYRRLPQACDTLR
jgi:hypothetical protein